MTATERAEFITSLYAARSNFGALFVTANQERLLTVAVSLASARDNITDAIERFENDTTTTSANPNPDPSKKLPAAKS